MTGQEIARKVVTLFTAASVSGCAAVDNFSPRALQYNDEASYTKSSTILMNIVRAAERRPLQFTEYTSAVGQANVSGQIGAAVPLGAIPSSTARTFILNPQISGSAQTQA